MFLFQAGRFIDGGLIATNPTLDVLTEINERNQALRGIGRAAEVEEVCIHNSRVIDISVFCNLR